MLHRSGLSLARAGKRGAFAQRAGAQCASVHVEGPQTTFDRRNQEPQPKLDENFFVVSNIINLSLHSNKVAFAHQLAQCARSWDPGHSHVWVLFPNFVNVAVARDSAELAVLKMRPQSRDSVQKKKLGVLQKLETKPQTFCQPEGQNYTNSKYCTKKRNLNSNKNYATFHIQSVMFQLNS